MLHVDDEDLHASLLSIEARVARIAVILYATLPDDHSSRRRETWRAACRLRNMLARDRADALGGPEGNIKESDR